MVRTRVSPMWLVGLGAVEGDTVHLTGSVPDAATREKIVLAVGNVHGVAKVDDQLQGGEAPGVKQRRGDEHALARVERDAGDDHRQWAQVGRVAPTGALRRAGGARGQHDDRARLLRRGAAGCFKQPKVDG